MINYHRVLIANQHWKTRMQCYEQFVFPDIID